MIAAEKHFRMYANCIPVKGANRSLICDLQKKRLEIIPNSMYGLLTENRTKSIGAIKEIYGKENEEALDGYFNYLLEKEFIFLCNEGDLDFFPDLDLSWETPSLIENAIIDIDDASQHNYADIFSQLVDLGCIAIHLRFLAPIATDEVEKILDTLRTSRIESIDLLMPYSLGCTRELIENWIDKYSRIFSIVIHNAPEKIPFEYDDLSVAIIWVEKIIDSNAHCGIIAPKHFNVNLNSFLESLQHNTCLNQKISINQNGDIKNCPSLPSSFGNIKDTKLADVLDKDGFKKYWNINKDQIDTCKECEFRHICTDCRAYREDPENIYSKPLKCGYNPHTNEWKEWSTNPLKQKAIEFYKLKEVLSNKETMQS